MKKYILISFMIIISLNATSQKLDSWYISSITGDTLTTLKWQNLVYDKTILFSFRMVHINSNYTLELKYNFGDAQPFNVDKNDSIWLKCDNGLTLRLFSAYAVESKKGLSAYDGSVIGNTTYGVYVKYSITYMELKAIELQYVEKIRIFTSRGFDNVFFDIWDQKAISESARLITKKIEDYPIYSNSIEEKPYVDPQKDDKW